MVGFGEALADYVQTAARFEARLSTLLGERKPAILRVDELKRSYKVACLHEWRGGLYARVDKDGGDISDFIHDARRRTVGNILSGNYGLPSIPDVGSREATLWNAWYGSFTEIPFPLSGALIKLIEANEVDAVVEAIEITASKQPKIPNGEARIRYVQGILRQNLLKKVAPELAAQMAQYFSLQIYWKISGTGLAT